MGKWVVAAEVTISMHVTVEAETEEEARIAAENAPMMNLCHHCASRHDDEWSTSGEFDGEPIITAVEKL